MPRRFSPVLHSTSFMWVIIAVCLVEGGADDTQRFGIGAPLALEEAAIGMSQQPEGVGNTVLSVVVVRRNRPTTCAKIVSTRLLQLGAACTKVVASGFCSYGRSFPLHARRPSLISMAYCLVPLGSQLRDLGTMGNNRIHDFGLLISSDSTGTSVSLNHRQRFPSPVHAVLLGHRPALGSLSFGLITTREIKVLATAGCSRQQSTHLTFAGLVLLTSQNSM